MPLSRPAVPMHTPPVMALAAAAALSAQQPPARASTAPFTLADVRSYPYADELVAATRAQRVAYVRDRQLWLAPMDGSASPRRIVTVRGDLREPQWSPDGRHLAFVADRDDHAFVGVYTNDSTPIRWMAPSTGRDNQPRWSPDGRRLAFVRRPGVGGPPDSVLRPPPLPWRLLVAVVTTGEGRVVWKAPATRRGGYARTFPPAPLYAANGTLVFRSYEDGWPHLYAVRDTGGPARLLTPGAWRRAASRTRSASSPTTTTTGCAT
jgi:dipeptidyl aminopeptidase/acylaminoacyl peptidase